MTNRPTCPKCGAKYAYTMKNGIVLFQCHTAIYPNGSASHSKYCRIAELEQQLAEAQKRGERLEKIIDLHRGIPKLDSQDVLESLVFWAYKYVEISIGRACELLRCNIPDFREKFYKTHPEGQIDVDELLARQTLEEP